MTPQPKSKTTFFILVGMGTAILLAAPVVILLFIGVFLDSIFHAGNLYMIMGIIVGFVGGIVNIFRLVQMMQKRKK
ncbi:MAG: AtpZ/AtpI family protein [Candidatus Levyibacteriota bacterium]